MKINAYLNFNGNCEAAFRFYESCLGGQIVMMMTHGDSPIEAPPGWEKMIIHARLIVGDAVLMGSDAPPDQYNGAHGFSVSVVVDTAEEADRVFAALSEGGSVHMPIGETFWAVRFGMLIDKFGIPWMINCEKSFEPS